MQCDSETMQFHVQQSKKGQLMHYKVLKHTVQCIQLLHTDIQEMEQVISFNALCNAFSAMHTAQCISVRCRLLYAVSQLFTRSTQVSPTANVDFVCLCRLTKGASTGKQTCQLPHRHLCINWCLYGDADI